MKYTIKDIMNHYDEGFDVGFDEGYEKGQELADERLDDFYDNGYVDGYDVGFYEGFYEGYDEAFGKGYEQRKLEENEEDAFPVGTLDLYESKLVLENRLERIKNDIEWIDRIIENQERKYRDSRY